MPSSLRKNFDIYLAESGEKIGKYSAHSCRQAVLLAAQDKIEPTGNTRQKAKEKPVELEVRFPSDDIVQSRDEKEILEKYKVWIWREQETKNKKSNCTRI